MQAAVALEGARQDQAGGGLDLADLREDPALVRLQSGGAPAQDASGVGEGVRGQAPEPVEERLLRRPGRRQPRDERGHHHADEGALHPGGGELQGGSRRQHGGDDDDGGGDSRQQGPVAMHAPQHMGQAAVEGDPQAQQGELGVRVDGHMQDREAHGRAQQGAHHAEQGPLQEHPAGSLGHHPHGHGRPVGVLHVHQRGDGEGHPGRQGQHQPPRHHLTIEGDGPHPSPFTSSRSRLCSRLRRAKRPGWVASASGASSWTARPSSSTSTRAQVSATNTRCVASTSVDLPR